MSTSETAQDRSFFDDPDDALYRESLADNSPRGQGRGVDGVPDAEPCAPDPGAIRSRRVHRSYAGIIQARRKRSGHFWQGRFGAVAMDEDHLAAALRYVSLNPVRARLVARAQDWRWASARAHLTGKDDGITARAPIRERFPRFAELIAAESDADAFARLRAAETIGRPLGDDRFLAWIERSTKRCLKPRKREPKPRAQADANDDKQLDALSP